MNLRPMKEEKDGYMALWREYEVIEIHLICLYGMFKEGIL